MSTTDMNLLINPNRLF